MKKNTAYITVLLIAVLLAAVLSIRIFFSSRRTETPEETPPPPSWSATLPPAETLTEAPAPTETPPVTPPPPVVTERPAATPAPTVPPTPPPTPTLPPATASGSFSSATGTNLNLVADWRAYTDGSGNRKLRVDLSALSYSFTTDALWNALDLTVNGVTYSANSPAIRYNGDALHSSSLASFTLDAPSGTVSLSATWHYKGSYSGVELNDITAYGTAYIP